jgi:FkbM family methyltransferase
MYPPLLTELGQARAVGLDLPAYRQIRAAHLHLLPSLSVLRTGIILDLGANIGDWTAAVLRAEPKAQIIAVEPAPEPREILKRRFGNRITIDSRAVSSESGIATLHITRHSHNSSLLAPHALSDALYGGLGGWEVKDTREVETTTVDELVAGRAVALLKIDVQGAEREVLAGAMQTLTHTRAVLLEVTFVSHYHGDTTFPALHTYLTHHGFELVGLSEPYLSSRRTMLWCDACYLRQTDS